MLDTNALRTVADECARLAGRLPFSVIQGVVDDLALADAADWTTGRAKLLAALPHPHYRSLVAALLDRCQNCAARISPQTVAAALLAAAAVEKAKREGESVELVWTGPDCDVGAVRRTEQAILQVIDAAARRLTVISYAVYRIPRICDALVRAAERGVAIKVVVETPDRLEGENAYDTLAALGPSVASRCQVYFWPPEKRLTDDRGRMGILHVKCIVADDRLLFLSSANLTEYAFTLNMELGLLTTGGSLPAQIAAHFDQLIESGVLAIATTAPGAKGQTAGERRG